MRKNILLDKIQNNLLLSIWKDNKLREKENKKKYTTKKMDINYSTKWLNEFKTVGPKTKQKKRNHFTHSLDSGNRICGIMNEKKIIMSLKQSKKNEKKPYLIVWIKTVDIAFLVNYRQRG